MQDTWEMWVQSLVQEDPLEEGMATYSSILAWRIPWTEEPGRLQSTGSRRVRLNWATSLSIFPKAGHSWRCFTRLMALFTLLPHCLSLSILLFDFSSSPLLSLVLPPSSCKTTGKLRKYPLSDSVHSSVNVIENGFQSIGWWTGSNVCAESGMQTYILVAQSCLTLCDPMACSPIGSSVLGDSSGKNTRVGCHALLQGIFPPQGSNPGLPHCRRILYQLSYRGSPMKVKAISKSYRMWLNLYLEENIEPLIF